jgi:predicted DNA-binding antitoxin AbrB/MazE fold protein
VTTIEAVYQGGVFKPLGEVKLAENQRVQVLVPGEASAPVQPRRSLGDLVGLIRTDGDPPTDEECDRILEEELVRKHL